MTNFFDFKSILYGATVKILFLCVTFFASQRAMSQNEIFCPQGPSQHLNENFPAKVLALSTQNYSITDLRKIIHTLFQNNSKDKVPNIVLFDQDDKARILFDEINPEYKDKWLNSVKVIPSQVVWAQDFFEGFVSAQGTPFIRLVNGYKKGRDKNQYENYLSAQALLSDMFSKEFNISTQTSINDTSNEAAKNGHKGGNIESTNEGYCLIGNSDLNEKEWDELARQNCSGPENAIKLPTDWLPANHVDELIKQLPTRNLKSCQPTFAISSPQKTMEILNMYPDEKFFNSEIKTDSTYMYDRSALSEVCATFLLKRHLPEGLFISNKILATPQFTPITPREGYTIYRMPFSNEKNIDLFEKCTELRNKDILDLFQKDPYYTESLRIAQQKTEQSKKIIVDFYKSKRPDCMVHFIEMPTLLAVYKAQYYSEDRSKSVVVTTSEPILPNVLNNLKINQDVFVPNTGNKYINKYVQSALASFRLRTIVLDTFRLHVAGGNIHCSSQTIHQCQTLEVKRQPNSESICGWQNRKELLTEAETYLKKFEQNPFNPEYNLIGYPFTSEIQKALILARYEEEGEALKLKQKTFPAKYPELSDVIKVFNDLMSTQSLRIAKNKIVLNFDLNLNCKDIACARTGAVAMIETPVENLNSYINSINADDREKNLKFILGHELGHLITESVRSQEINSFDKANELEFYGNLKHHILVDVVSMLLNDMTFEQLSDILNSFPERGDFARRRDCIKSLPN